MVTPTLGSSRLAGSMQARMRGLAQDAARRVASSIGTLQEVEGELHLQLDEMAPGMRLPPSAYYITRSLALDAELHPGFGLVAGQRVLVQWVGATPLIVDVLAAPGTTEELRLTPTSPAGGALTGDYPNPGLAPDSVATAHIQAGAVTGSGSGAMLLASGGEPAIAPGAIGGADIADNAITTPKLVDGAVTTPKLGTGLSLTGGLTVAGSATADLTTPGWVLSRPIATMAQQRSTNQSYTLMANLAGHHGANVYFGTDGQWHRVDTGQGAVLFIVTANTLVYYYAAAGANPITWQKTAIRLCGSDVDQAWQTPTFAGTWASYSAPFHCRYRKLPDGVVIVRGLVQGGALTMGATNPFFTLPVGYRPPASMQYLFTCSNVNGVARIDVDSAGNVFWQEAKAGTLSSGWQSLDGVTFLAEA